MAAGAHLAAELAAPQRVEVALEVVAVEVGAAEDQAVVHLDRVYQLCVSGKTDHSWNS